jgi:hypothetical protein
MENLILPARAIIQLIDRSGGALRIPNVLLGITAFAARKDDFRLQPFASDNDGLVTILKKDLEAEVAACHDSGLMNYGHIRECSASVAIRLLTEEELEKTVDARTKIWKNLLIGERDRWNSIEQLLTLYKTASNGRFLPGQALPMRVKWNNDAAEYSYKFVLVPREHSL